MQAARQQVTRDWWDLKRAQQELFTSQIVLDEIRCGEAEMGQQREAKLAGITLLPASEESEMLTQRILDSHVLPIGAGRDAAHIALATVYKMDILLSWNLRHIANAAIQTSLRRLMAELGLTLPLLCTPDELTGDLYEQSDEND